MTEKDDNKILEWFKKRKRLLIGIGTIAIILLMVFLVDFSNLIQKIITIGFWGFFLFILSYTIAFILRAYKLKLIFKGLDQKISYSTSFFSIGASFLINDTTPGKLGDVVKIFIVKDQENLELSDALAGIAVERILDLLLLLIISCIALIYLYLENFNNFSEIKTLGLNIQFYLAIGVIFIIVIISVLLLVIYKTDLVMKISAKISLKLSEYIHKFIVNFKEALKKFKDNKKELIFVVLLGFLIWFIDAFIIVIIFYLSGYELNMVLLILAILLSFLSKIFPISPGGWGISENVGAIFIFFFYPEIQFTQILSMFIIDHLFRSAYLIFFGGYSIFHYNINLRKSKELIL